VTKEIAERIAAVAELVLSDEDSDAPLRQLADLCLELIPGSAGAGLVAAGEGMWMYSQSDPAVAGLHREQMEAGDGPVAETLRYGEARRIDDAQAETRWPAVCAAMLAEDLRSCLVLPLRTDRRPGAALAVYGRQTDSFTGSGHDIALLFAAQGGVAVRNASVYRNCRQLVANLNVALESRAVIEQAKGILVAEHGCTPEVAFKRLSVMSQNSNRKVREISADLVEGRIQQNQFRDDG
jgi:transcriptional regulator with GAF, ATPase, and Fis domain